MPDEQGYRGPLLGIRGQDSYKRGFSHSVMSELVPHRTIKKQHTAEPNRKSRKPQWPRAKREGRGGNVPDDALATQDSRGRDWTVGPQLLSMTSTCGCKLRPSLGSARNPQRPSVSTCGTAGRLPSLHKMSKKGTESGCATQRAGRGTEHRDRRPLRPETRRPACAETATGSTPRAELRTRTDEVTHTHVHAHAHTTIHTIHTLVFPLLSCGNRTTRELSFFPRSRRCEGVQLIPEQGHVARPQRLKPSVDSDAEARRRCTRAAGRDRRICVPASRGPFEWRLQTVSQRK